MSPSIARRRRPRLRSVNWRRVFYLVRLEAALHVMFPAPLGPESERLCRLQILDTEPRNLAATVDKLLRYEPRRRYWPS